jgi:uncharacterized membrane protein HdeD (DUF308 family)
MGTFASPSREWLEPAGPGRLHVLIWSACIALLGLLLLAAPVASAAALATIVGACWLVGGVVSAIAALWQRGGNWGWRLAGGAATALGGLAVVAYPLFAAYVVVETLFLVLAMAAFVTGLVTLSSSHSIGTVLLGLALLAIGFLLVFEAFHLVALVGLVQWMGLFAIGAALVNGVSAVVGRGSASGE